MLVKPANLLLKNMVDTLSITTEKHSIDLFVSQIIEDIPVSGIVNFTYDSFQTIKYTLRMTKLRHHDRSFRYKAVPWLNLCSVTRLK